jgi:hypothetical protein
MTTLGAGARWMLRSEDVGSEVVDLSFLLDFVDGMQWIQVQDSTGTFHSRCATSTYASLLAAGLFIDSQSLVSDGASSDLTIVESWHLFKHCLGRHWILAAALTSASVGNPMDGSEFFYPFGCYLQSF